jgi:hypothetical protein
MKNGSYGGAPNRFKLNDVESYQFALIDRPLGETVLPPRPLHADLRV